MVEEKKRGGARPGSGRRNYDPEGGASVVSWKISQPARARMTALAREQGKTIGEVLDTLLGI